MLHKAKFAVCSEIHKKTHKFHVITMQNFLMLNLVVRTVSGSFRRLMQALYWRYAVVDVCKTQFIKKPNGMESVNINVKTLEGTILRRGLKEIK
jgi:hypothetical protein